MLLAGKILRRKNPGANCGNSGRAEADSKLAAAKAEAETIRVKGAAEAETIRLKSAAEAEAIRLRGEALRDNPCLVALTTAERWDGKLPDTMIPGSTVPFISTK